MDAGLRTGRYCREIIEERLPADVRQAMRARALVEGSTVQEILLGALARDGLTVAEPYLVRIKRQQQEEE